MEKFSELFKKFQEMSNVCNRVDMEDENGLYFYQIKGKSKHIYMKNLLKFGVDEGDYSVCQMSDNSINLIRFEKIDFDTIKIKEKENLLVIEQAGKQTITDYEAGQIQELLDDQEFWFYLALKGSVFF